MNNYLLVMVGMFEKLGHLSADEAKELAEKLSTHTLPGTYKEASRLIEDLFEEVEIVVNKTSTYLTDELSNKNRTKK